MVEESRGDKEVECEKIKEKLYLYSVGSLSRRLRTKVDRHLSTCPECMKEFKAIEVAIGVVEKLPHEEPPEGMWSRVLLKIREQEERDRGRKWIELQQILELLRSRSIPLITTVAFIILIIGGVYFYEKYSYQTPEKFQQSYLTEYVTFSLHDPLADKIALGRMITVKPENEGIK